MGWDEVRWGGMGSARVCDERDARGGLGWDGLGLVGMGWHEVGWVGLGWDGMGRDWMQCEGGR